MEKNLHKYGECGEKFSKNHQLHAGDSGLWVEIRSVEKPFVKWQTLSHSCTQDSKGKAPCVGAGVGWVGVGKAITSDNPEESQPCCRYRKPFSFLSALP